MTTRQTIFYGIILAPVWIPFVLVLFVIEFVRGLRRRSLTHAEKVALSRLLADYPASSVTPSLVRKLSRDL